MFNERKSPDQETQTWTPRPIPDALAEKFLQGSLADAMPMVHSGDHSDIYRCFERPEDIPGLKETKLRVDYNKYRGKRPRQPDQLRFEYTQINTENGADDLLAEMHLGIRDQQTFILEHRYVQPHVRGNKGLGTKLYRQAESWLQSVANIAKKDLLVGAEVGQEDLISWFEKIGFTVEEGQKELVDEIRQHPENFVIEDIVDTDGVLKSKFIFHKNVPGRTRHDAIRLVFTKTIKASE